MPNLKTPEAALPAMGAAGLLLAGAASHRALLGVVCAAVVFLGLYLRTLAGKRLVGNLLFIAGALTFCLVLLFDTGASLGGDMAGRDAAQVGQGAAIGTAQ